MKEFDSFISPVRKSLECLFIYPRQPNNLLSSEKKTPISFISKKEMFTSWYLGYFTPKSLLTEVYFTVSEGLLSKGNFLTKQCCLLWFLRYNFTSSNQHLCKYLQEQVTCLLEIPHWCQQKTFSSSCRVLPCERPVKHKKKLMSSW